MPTIIILIYKIQNEETFKQNLILIIKSAFTWVLGYSLIFISKWIFSSFVFKKNMIIESINQFLVRSDILGTNSINKMDVIRSNFNWFFSPLLIKILIILFAIWLIFVIKYRKKLKKLKNCVLILIIGISPYVWYFIMSQHSFIHVFFTNKIQVISLFSLLSIMIYSIDLKKIFSDIIKISNKVTTKTKIKK